MKVLFVATVRSHIGQFHMPFIRELVRRGCRVEAAFKDNSVDKPGLDLSGIARTYEVPFSRSPYSVDNLKAYQVLKKIIDEGRYDAIHCHNAIRRAVSFLKKYFELLRKKYKVFRQERAEQVRLLEIALSISLRGEPGCKSIRQIKKSPVVPRLSCNKFKFIELGSQTAFFVFFIDTEDYTLRRRDIIAPGDRNIFVIGL
jgi:hypothetical protein